jgi:hypothetical protein
MVGRPSNGNPGYPHTIVDKTQVATIGSTPTVLDGPRLLGDSAAALEFAFWNDDLTDKITFLITASGDPTKNSISYQWQVGPLDPGGHDMAHFPNMNIPVLLARYWTVTAQKSTPGGTAVGSFEIAGVSRAH